MRYSDVLHWYGVSVTGSIKDRVDILFTLACTHWQLANLAEYGGYIEMHSGRMKIYILMMKDLIRVHGDFRGNEDPSLRGLHLRKNWRGSDLPDPEMFRSMPKSTYLPGQDLAEDFLYLPSIHFRPINIGKAVIN